MSGTAASEGKRQRGKCQERASTLIGYDSTVTSKMDQSISQTRQQMLKVGWNIQRDGEQSQENGPENQEQIFTQSPSLPICVTLHPGQFINPLNGNDRIVR